MSWRSPRSPKRTGRRSGRTTPSSGSTRRSSAEPMSWRSSPTPQRSCAWQPPWSSNPTTNGRSPAAISPMSPWTNYAPSSPQNTRPQHWTNNTKSPSVQQDSLITMRKPRQDPKSTNSRDAIVLAGVGQRQEHSFIGAERLGHDDGRTVLGAAAALLRCCQLVFGGAQDVGFGGQPPFQQPHDVLVGQLPLGFLAAAVILSAHPSAGPRRRRQVHQEVANTGSGGRREGVVRMLSGSLIRVRVMPSRRSDRPAELREGARHAYRKSGPALDGRG